MFEFEVIQDLKFNDKILEIIKDYNYIVKNGTRKIQYFKIYNYCPSKHCICLPAQTQKWVMNARPQKLIKIWNRKE